MQQRFVAIWFRSLKTDWFIRRQPSLGSIPFVLASPDHGRMMITAVDSLAESNGIVKGMVVADARVILPTLKVLDAQPGLEDKLLNRLAEWCIRFTPVVALDLPDGVILDVTGCAHLWGGEELYLQHMKDRLKHLGYHVNAAIADTIGAAWAFARFGSGSVIVETKKQATALLTLPPQSLRLEEETIERLHSLGLRTIQHFINMPRSTLRRRFGEVFIKRLDHALGKEEEIIIPIHPIAIYCERLNCLEPIITLTGIEIALERLLECLCSRLQREQKGLRTACLSCYRVDGKTIAVEVGTNRATTNTKHLFKLFQDKLSTIDPDLGIELFTLQAKTTEDIISSQGMLWQQTGGLHDTELAELMDRFAGKFGAQAIHRYLPADHYWPERSFKKAQTVFEEKKTEWVVDRLRPTQLLSTPEIIEITAPIPDYPPMMFRYKKKLHKIIKADGPERIEQEWWLQQGQHRDYYIVEDEEGNRYWLFRLGHYTDDTYQWFIHGFFA